MDFIALIFMKRKNNRQYFMKSSYNKFDAERKFFFLFLWATNCARAQEFLVDFMLKIFRCKFQQTLY
jgi:hypothetical protein